MNGRVREPEEPEEAPVVDESSNSTSWSELNSPGDKPRRRPRVILASLAALAVLVVVAAVVLWFVPLLRVNAVEVDGAAQIDPQAVVDATGVDEGENLLRVDTMEAARGVVELPRVREATVSRSLTGTVTVEVVERRVVAWLDDGGQQVLVDDEGGTFVDGQAPPSAVRVEGAGVDDRERLEGAVAVASALSEDVAAQIDHVSVDGPYEYTLHTVDGRTVDWGAPEDNANKAVALEAVLQREGQNWDVSNPAMVTSR